MLSLTISSQNTRTKVVKVSTLQNIKRKIDKCDSMAIAYLQLQKQFDFLIETNLTYFGQINTYQSETERLQLELDQSVKALRKKKNAWQLPTALGLVGGLIGGVLLANQ